MSQFPQKAQIEFEILHEKNSSFKELIILQKTIHTLREDYNKLSKATEETNKGLNQVLEEEYYCRRDREYLDQDMKTLLDVFQNINPQTQGHVFGNTPHLHVDIKPDLAREMDKNPYEWCLKHSKGLQAIDPDVKTQMRNQKVPTQFPGELEPAVKNRCNKDRTLDDIANILQEVSTRTSINRYDTHKTGDKLENKTLETK
ncbi:hypothetical protein O181_095742 [Austropuccinia psidii MF-1]|uniref:Uncharacterized protein n=1 Tax=Austropuccinia psidii MF-1 TaxID=1389203 RepID=A0A9Q3PCU7_9BASI|nr:hypothetical protein [Austropuccinia psidii MF-1]